jgi:DNA-binding response OmpR family regulator
MRHLLLVEDDPFLRTVTNEFLVGVGYDVMMAINLQMARELYQNHEFDMILLDVTLPDGNGFDWAKELIQSPSRPPIIYLTSHTDNIDVKKGFELGGADYMKKPIDMEELNIRIKHTLKDFNTGSGLERQIGEYIYNPTSHLLTYKGTSLHLGQLQGVVLNELSACIGNVVTKDELLIKYWGESNYFTSRNLDSVIVKLRTQFKQDPRVFFMALKRKGYQLLIHDIPLK